MKYNLKKIIKYIKNLFIALKIPSSDVEDLVIYLLSIQLQDLYLYDIMIDAKQLNALMQLINRRIKGEPTAYIIGYRQFWEYKFKVTSDTLIPRNDTEILVESVLERFKSKKINKKLIKVLDLGTGSGCISISILKELKKLGYLTYGLGIDISQPAINIAIQNANNLELQSNEVQFICSDWNYLNLERFDIIVSNPPYIPSCDINSLEVGVKDYEPHIALDGGKNGFACYIKILQVIKKVTSKETIIGLEFGINQAKAIIKLMADFHHKSIIKDLSGIERIIIAENV